MEFNPGDRVRVTASFWLNVESGNLGTVLKTNVRTDGRLEIAVHLDNKIYADEEDYHFFFEDQLTKVEDTMFSIGDRVRINCSDLSFDGMVGHIQKEVSGLFSVFLDELSTSYPNGFFFEGRQLIKIDEQEKSGFRPGDRVRHKDYYSEAVHGTGTVQEKAIPIEDRVAVRFDKDKYGSHLEAHFIPKSDLELVQPFTIGDRVIYIGKNDTYKGLRSMMDGTITAKDKSHWNRWIVEIDRYEYDGKFYSLRHFLSLSEDEIRLNK